MMHAVRYLEMRRKRLDIAMTFHRFTDLYLIRILFLRSAMHELDLYHIANIFMKLAPVTSTIRRMDSASKKQSD